MGYRGMYLCWCRLWKSTEVFCNFIKTTFPSDSNGRVTRIPLCGTRSRFTFRSVDGKRCQNDVTSVGVFGLTRREQFFTCQFATESPKGAEQCRADVMCSVIVITKLVHIKQLTSEPNNNHIWWLESIVKTVMLQMRHEKLFACFDGARQVFVCTFNVSAATLKSDVCWATDIMSHP